eukprot:TRINITY_DN6808_c1_g1_i1.p1 TRINITY_DN6808_c1_g1~~TRINITY_DN6808_c1_g1_i1.p1  ORF type:complete len:648 (-),score=75.50 TRINITY_DN6808_c1_g1_i1:83-2026(-)
MIIYEAGEYHLGFIFSLEGSTIPKAFLFSLPAALMSFAWRLLFDYYPTSATLRPFMNIDSTLAWSGLVLVLSMMLGFRTNKAYARFWEGTTLVQQMRAEWFEACNNLTAFSNFTVVKNPGDRMVKERVVRFQYTLIRLVSLMHAAALRQVTGGDGEEFDVLDVQGLDDESMDYLSVECAIHEINRVEVLLHWVQVLITEGIATGVLVVPPPILTRSYQTLSRGMVNLHNVRKLADVPFPFPLSQLIIVLLLFQTALTPILVAAVIKSLVGAPIVTFLPLFGMWSVTFISGELEQPFGQDPNDLPLTELQFEMNNSLLMLLDERAQTHPVLKEGSTLDVMALRSSLGDPESNTAFLGNVPTAERISRMNKSKRSMVSCSGKPGEAGYNSDAGSEAPSSHLSDQSDLGVDPVKLEVSFPAESKKRLESSKLPSPPSSENDGKDVPGDPQSALAAETSNAAPSKTPLIEGVTTGFLPPPPAVDQINGFKESYQDPERFVEVYRETGDSEANFRHDIQEGYWGHFRGQVARCNNSPPKFNSSGDHADNVPPSNCSAKHSENCTELPRLHVQPLMHASLQDSASPERGQLSFNGPAVADDDDVAPQPYSPSLAAEKVVASQNRLRPASKLPEVAGTPSAGGSVRGVNAPSSR